MDFKIYIIKNTINNKVYIGQTSKSLIVRKGGTKWQGYHGCTKIENKNILADTRSIRKIAEYYNCSRTPILRIKGQNGV